jgi:hypothetical protein
MANTILTESRIAREVMKAVKNNMVMGNSVHRQYKREFVNPKPSHRKPGSSISIEKPVKYRTKSGATMDSVDMYERTHTLTIDQRHHVALTYTMQEKTMDIVSFREKHITPAALALANKVDDYLTGMYQKIYNAVGTPGTTPSTFAQVSPAAVRLTDEAAPMEDRNMVFSPNTSMSVANGISGLYNPAMVEGAVRRGSIGEFAGFGSVKWDQNIRRHTTGTFSTGSTPLVAGTTAEGATSLATDGWANSTAVLKEGDRFTIAGVYAVNPVSGRAYSWLRQFVVTSDVTSSGTGTATIPISPAIYSSAAGETYLPYQTVDTLPADNAAITVLGSEDTAYEQNLCFQKNAIALVMCPLAEPQGAAYAERITSDGISIRYVVDYSIDSDEQKMRCDILFGADVIYPELATVLVGS